MFENLKSQPKDKIMELMSIFSNDKRLEKIDLGIGVYKNQLGNTPIMSSVKKAEAMLLEKQISKSYVGLAGSLNFLENIKSLIFNRELEDDRISCVQVPGGTGAIHQLLNLVKKSDFKNRVFLPNPSWPNHKAILSYLNIEFEEYYYFDEISCEVNFEKMLYDITKANDGDIILLHGCCHNPTGANLKKDDWVKLTEIFLKKNLLPFIDLAYQGFGDGLQNDVFGLRYLSKNIPEMLIAVSCSKNFGVYRDRVGSAIVISKNKKSSQIVDDNLKSLNRLTYSFPPDHGASVVNEVLSNESLLNEWKAELEAMRNNMLSIRKKLSESLKKKTNSSRFDFINNHRGMFSRLGIEEKKVEILRNKFGIYMVSDSRINIAGLPEKKIDFLATSISSVI